LEGFSWISPREALEVFESFRAVLFKTRKPGFSGASNTANYRARKKFMRNLKHQRANFCFERLKTYSNNSNLPQPLKLNGTWSILGQNTFQLQSWFI
jgi:hypothetical protein